MKKIINQLFIFYLAIVLLKILLSLLIPSPSIFSDDYVYIKLARSFFFDFNFTIHGVAVDVYPPLYPMLLSISYLFKDMTIIYPLMKVINALVSSLIIIPAFLLSKEFFNEKKSLIIALFISFIPSNFSFSPYIMSENLFYPLSLFTLYFIYKSFLENGYKYNVLAGVFLALSYLTRTIAINIVGALVVSYVILFFIGKINRSLIVKKFFVSFCFFIVIISPWMIRNFYLYGFNLKLLFGPYAQSALNIVTKFKLMNYIIKFLVYISYLILASLIIFPFKLTSIFNKKNLNFLILLIPLLIATLVIAANHGSRVVFFEWFTGRYIGRYVDFLLPLIFIGGFIGAERIKVINKATVAIFSFFLVIGSLLTLHSLFPLNNMSLTWAGVLKYIFEFFFYDKIDYSIRLFTGSIIFFIALFLLLFILLLFLEKTFSLKKLLPYFFIFLILLNLLNYSVDYYDSKVNWYDQEQMQLGLWLNNYDSGKISNVLFDEESCGQLTKAEQEKICGGAGNARTVIGYWLNDNIFVGDISKAQEYDYVISKNELDLPLIKKSGNGIYIYGIK